MFDVPRPFDRASAAPPEVCVLVVEDSPGEASLLSQLLHRELVGATVRITYSLGDAVAALDESVDVVITDLALPDAAGLEALHAVRAARPDVPVVVMTGRDDRATALEAVAAGADDYLVKGHSDGRGVATAVLYALQRRRAKDAMDGYNRLAMDLLNAMEHPTCAVDPDGRVIAVNRSWRNFAVQNGGDVHRTGVGVDYFAVCHQAAAVDPSVSAVADGLCEVLAARVPRFEHTYYCPTSDGERWFSMRVNPLPESGGAVVTHVDVTAAKQAEMAVAHQSLHDALTDLPNRTLFSDRLDGALALAGREGRHVAVAFVDLDHFKRINDSLGHHVGDQLLKAVGARLVASVRAGDTVARFAGDEFVLLWPAVASHGEAEELVQRLTDAFEEPFDVDGTLLSVTASTGVVVGSSPQTSSDLLAAADAAMYAGKQLGRGRVRFYTEELGQSVSERLAMEKDIVQGLARGEFTLHYQPVVDLHANTVSGVEALIRWNHPDGLRMPDSFIPIAEDTGLIVQLGAWVVEQACAQAAAWRAEGLDLAMAVNLSARQASHPTILATLTDALQRSGLPADRLLVEVTESAVMDDSERAAAALSSIAGAGIRIAIDDFGTGYSSLVYLKRYPIDALKVDRSFVAGIGTNPDDDAIVQTIFGLAKAVGADCIAEGVETVAQLADLRAMGCGYAQGYLFAKPLPPDQIHSAVAACTTALTSSGADERMNPPHPGESAGSRTDEPRLPAAVGPGTMEVVT